MASTDFTTGLGTNAPWSNSPNIVLYKNKFKASDVASLGTSDVYLMFHIPAKSVILLAWMNIRVASASGTVALGDGTVTWSTATAPTATGPAPLTAVTPVVTTALRDVSITVASAALATTCEIDVYALVVDSSADDVGF